MRRKKIMKIMLIVAIIIIVIFFVFMLWLAGFVVSGGKRQTIDEAMAWQSERYDTSFYNQLEKNDYTVEGADGYILHAQLLVNPESTNKYIIISHGYTDNRIGALKYVQMYLDFGFNCIIYDLRGHGLNESTYTTYGILESQDLLNLIADTKERYNNIDVLGLHGESLGAATTITALKYNPEVDFVVADCGFSDIENVLREGYKSANLPGIAVDIANLGLQLRYHYSFDDMRPIEALNNNEVPILFMHGAEDNFILPKNSASMQAATKGYSELYLLSGAAHAESILVQPDEYKHDVEGFLQNVI